mgnify:CR=1 FL=1
MKKSLLPLLIFITTIACAQSDLVPSGKYLLVNQSLVCPMQKIITLYTFTKEDSLAFVKEGKAVTSMEFPVGDVILTSENLKEFVCNTEPLRQVESIKWTSANKEIAVDIKGKQLKADKKTTESFSITLIYESKVVNNKKFELSLKARNYNY